MSKQLLTIFCIILLSFPMVGGTQTSNNEYKPTISDQVFLQDIYNRIDKLHTESYDRSTTLHIINQTQLQYSATTRIFYYLDSIKTHIQLKYQTGSETILLQSCDYEDWEGYQEGNYCSPFITETRPDCLIDYYLAEKNIVIKEVMFTEPLPGEACEACSDRCNRGRVHILLE